MAKSLRKKRSSPSTTTTTKKSENISMAPPLPKFRMTSKRASLIISALLIVIVVVTLSVSLKVRRVFQHSGSPPPPLNRIYSGEVVNEFPHDPDAFTQGLLYGGNDTLFESTGLNGHSSVRKVALQTGQVEAVQNMQYAHFGEGLTLLNDRLFQVTWLKKTAFIYDRNNLSNVEMFTNPMPDGWGLATDGKVIFGSDGSSTLYKIEPQTLKLVEKHTVRYKGHEVHNLNELEYVNGEIWANVWMTDCIARLSGKDGSVLGWIYLPKLREGLLAAGNENIDVLNGIAWDHEKNRIFVTGKLWPRLYEIKVHPEPEFNGNIERLCLRNPVRF